MSGRVLMAKGMILKVFYLFGFCEAQEQNGESRRQSETRESIGR